MEFSFFCGKKRLQACFFILPIYIEIPSKTILQKISTQLFRIIMEKSYNPQREEI